MPDEQVIPRKLTVARPKWKFPKEAALWVAVVAVALGVPFAGHWVPELNYPGWEVCANFLLFMLAFWIDKFRNKEADERKAAEKWVPMAEAIVYRLITLQNEVRKMSLRASFSCGQTERRLPELSKVENAGLRAYMEVDCEAKADKLGIIASGLDDAVRDWHAFIVTNCSGEECGRIQNAIHERLDDCRREIDRLVEEANGKTA